MTADIHTVVTMVTVVSIYVTGMFLTVILDKDFKKDTIPKIHPQLGQ